MRAIAPAASGIVYARPVTGSAARSPVAGSAIAPKVTRKNTTTITTRTATATRVMAGPSRSTDAVPSTANAPRASVIAAAAASASAASVRAWSSAARISSTPRVGFGGPAAGFSAAPSPPLLRARGGGAASGSFFFWLVGTYVPGGPERTFRGGGTYVPGSLSAGGTMVPGFATESDGSRRVRPGADTRSLAPADLGSGSPRPH